MKTSILLLACSAALAMMFSFHRARAADELMREGTVISAGGGSLVFTDMAGKQVTFKVAEIPCPSRSTGTWPS